jgi:beta-N-acetylhexosaminidase
MHWKGLEPVIAIIFSLLLTACQTQKKAEETRPAPQEPATPGVQPAPAGPDASGRELERWGPPAKPFRDKLPGGPEQKVGVYLERLSLRQKIGQRFITGVPGTRMSNTIEKLVVEGCIGGVMLRKVNIQSRQQLESFTSELQATALSREPPIGLFIAVDQEGGRVNRLDFDTLTRFAAPYYWAEYEDPYYVEAAAYITGTEALSLGCNLNLAPVLDLYSVPDDSIVGDRSMGIDALKVGRRGVYYLLGARRAGIASVVKHFPGHGRTTVDSHLRLPVVDVEEKTLMDEDLVPFQMAIRHGVEAIMTAHILYSQIDPEYPATLSEKILKGLLRQRLGFRGVIVSDDIEMNALRSRYSPREIVKGCLNAGVDIILENGTLDVLELIEEAEQLVESGEVSLETVNEGLRRILFLKLKYGLL